MNYIVILTFYTNILRIDQQTYKRILLMNVEHIFVIYLQSLQWIIANMGMITSRNWNVNKHITLDLRCNLCYLDWEGVVIAEMKWEPHIKETEISWWKCVRSPPYENKTYYNNYECKKFLSI